MPHDETDIQHAFISDRDPGDETDSRHSLIDGNVGARSGLGAPSSPSPASRDEERVGLKANGSSTLARNRAPFPSGF